MTQSTFSRTTAKETNQPAEQAEEDKCSFVLVSHYHNKELFSVIRIWFNSREYRTIYSSPQVFMQLFQKKRLFSSHVRCPRREAGRCSECSLHKREFSACTVADYPANTNLCIRRRLLMHFQLVIMTRERLLFTVQPKAGRWMKPAYFAK